MENSSLNQTRLAPNKANQLTHVWNKGKANIKVTAHDFFSMSADNFTMANLPSNIVKFHQKFGLEFPDKPRMLTPEELHFRLETMREELAEYEEACAYYDEAKTNEERLKYMAQAMDALVDLTYFAIGTAYWHGFPFSAAWTRVHAANMNKERSMGTEDERSHRTHRGLDIVKPHDWVPASLEDLLT